MFIQTQKEHLVIHLYVSKTILLLDNVKRKGMNV